MRSYKNYYGFGLMFCLLSLVGCQNYLDSSSSGSSSSSGITVGKMQISEGVDGQNTLEFTVTNSGDTHLQSVSLMPLTPQLLMVAKNIQLSVGDIGAGDSVTAEWTIMGPGPMPGSPLLFHGEALTIDGTIIPVSILNEVEVLP